MIWNRMHAALFIHGRGGKGSHQNRAHQVLQFVHLALLAALFAAVAPAQSAFAAPRNVERVIATSERLSTATRSATAKCPSGTKVISTGGNINGEVGAIALTGIAPNDVLTTVKVTAAEVGNGTASTWSVTAIAICAAPLSGLQRVSVNTTTNSDGTKLLSMNCPGGKIALGVGATIKGLNSGQGSLNRFLPLSSLTGVFMGAVETGAGVSQDWSVRLDAICVDRSAVPDLERIVVTSAFESPAFQGVTALCPSGKQVIGAGGEVALGQTHQTALFGITPDAALTRVNTTGVEIAGGTASNWKAATYALCASIDRL